MTEKQICKNLGISVETANQYKHRYPEFADAIKKGKEVAITELENALFKRALGYDYEETKTSIKMVDGKETKFTEKTKKHMPSDVAACFILLKNKDRERGWADNPVKMELEKKMFELRKKAEEAKMF